MRAAVPAALEERQVLGVLDRGRLGEALNRLRQEVREIRDLHALRDLRLGQRRLFRAPGMNDRFFVLNLLPFERLVGAVDVEALAILPRGVEQAARHLGADVRVAQLERRALDRERAAVFRNQRLVDAPRAMADDVFGVLAEDRQARADAVRRVVHRRKAFPVPRPALHVLLVAAAQELDAPELALVVELLRKQVLAAVDDGLHHHVDLAALALRFDDLPAFVDRRGRRHRAGDVLPRLEGSNRLRRVVGNRRVDVHRIDVGVREQLLEARIPRLDAELVAAGVELLPIAPADPVHLRVRVLLIDGDELGAETETDDGYSDLVWHSIPQSNARVLSDRASAFSCLFAGPHSREFA